MNTNEGTIWTSNTKYVNIDTGEIIQKRTKEETKREIKQKYIIIKITKHYEFNKLKTRGHIEHTVECRRNPQGEFNFS